MKETVMTPAAMKLLLGAPLGLEELSESYSALDGEEEQAGQQMANQYRHPKGHTTRDGKQYTDY